MTIEVQTPRVIYIGNGTRGPFSLQDGSGNPIRLRTATDLVLWRYSSTTDEVGEQLVYSTDFTVTNTDPDATTFTLTSAQEVLTSSQRIVATRQQSVSQDLSLTLGGTFGAVSDMAQRDIVAEQIQELRRDVDRAIKTSWRSTATPDLPIAPSATKFLAHTSDDELTHVEVADISPTGVTLGTGWSDALALASASVLDNLSGVRFVADISELRGLAVATGLANNAAYQMLYYATAGDLGGGTFYYKSDLSSQVVFSTKTVSSVNTGTDVLTATAHGFWTEDVVIASAADAGLSLNTLYYVRWASANTITLHTSVMGARNNTGLVNITALAGSLSLKKLVDPGQGVYVIPTGAALDGSGGGFARAWDGVNASFAWWGATNTLASDQHPAMQAAVYFAGVRNGVVLNLASGSVGYRIDNKLYITKPNVKIRGPGGYQNHDGGAGVLPATWLHWYGAAGETMVEFKSPYGVNHSKISECELSGILLYGRAIAGRALMIDSVGSSLFQDVGILDVTVAGWETTCGVTGTDLPEAADTRDNRFLRITWRLRDSAAVQNADGYRANGSNNANTCFNYYERCEGSTYNGHGFEWIHCDNNVGVHCQGRIVTGTGKSMRFHGEVAGVSGGAYANLMINPSWGVNGCVRMGVASGFTGPATKNGIIHLDTANGSSAPIDDPDVIASTQGAGRVTTDTGHTYNEAGIQSIFGEGVGTILAARAIRETTNSVQIYNGAQNHLIVTDGTNSWVLRIASGNLDFSRTLGTGKFNLPAIANLLIGTAQLSYGANDSGGAGFKLLRVPN